MYQRHNRLKYISKTQENQENISKIQKTQVYYKRHVQTIVHIKDTKDASIKEVHKLKYISKTPKTQIHTKDTKNPRTYIGH